jgi:copper chaperone CopZ
MKSSSVRFSAWGLLAGLVGSLCCIGPSAALLLGLGSSSALLGLQLDQALARGAGFALLLGGVALALRRERACAARSIARWRQSALLLAAFALSYGLLGLLLPALAAQREDAATVPVAAVAAPASALRRATLIVEKMECPPCAASVRTLLERKPFVQHFVAESGNQQVIVDYDSRQIDARGLAGLIPRRYNVVLIGDEPLPNPLVVSRHSQALTTDN